MKRPPITINIPRSTPDSIIGNILFLGGMIAIAYGAWLIYHPAGFIVGGALAVWQGMVAADSEHEKP